MELQDGSIEETSSGGDGPPPHLLGLSMLILMEDQDLGKDDAYRTVMANWAKVGPISLTSPEVMARLLDIQV